MIYNECNTCTMWPCLLTSTLADSIDAIRNIGNIVAHTTKNKSTGEILPVEVGEAEWN